MWFIAWYFIEIPNFFFNCTQQRCSKFRWLPSLFKIFNAHIFITWVMFIKVCSFRGLHYRLSFWKTHFGSKLPFKNWIFINKKYFLKLREHRILRYLLCRMEMKNKENDFKTETTSFGFSNLLQYLFDRNYDTTNSNTTT